MINKRVFVRFVVEVDCARPHCVRRRPTGSTKDIVYIALSICYRTSPSSATTRRRETTVTSFLKAKFQDKTWICERKIEGGRSKRRPDLVLDMDSHIVIVEVDENKHDTYDRTCENRRLMEISQDLNHRHTVMIRFNPDGYVDPEQGRIPSPWTYSKHGMSTIKKKWKKVWESRLEVLRSTVQYWIEERSNKTIEVIELYY